VTFLEDGPRRAPWTIVLAHGAGAPMDSPFMNRVASGLAASGHRVLRFEFPYMQKRRETGRGGGPDREPVLRKAWAEAIAAAGKPAKLVIGGKSMGGRIASMVVDDSGVAGLVCLGYPFHPPGQPTRLRTAHLEKLETRALIVQGTRDPFGTEDDVAGYRLSRQIALHWLGDGDHDWKPRKASGRTHDRNLDEGIAAITGFIEVL